MKRIILFLYILIPCLTFAQQDNAVYHLIAKSYCLNADGSVDYHFRKELQLLTKSAFDIYGETVIPFNTEYQTLKINEAYTVRKDGSVVQTPANAFNPSLPYSCTECERFNSIREMVVTHTALEDDATIVLDYTIHTQQPFVKAIIERVDFCASEPVERYEVSVITPNYLTVGYDTHFNHFPMTVRNLETDSTHGIRWTALNVPKHTKDAYIPMDYEPYLSIFTPGGPEYFVDNFMLQNAIYNYPSDLFQETLKQILKDAKNLQDTVIAVRNYVAENVHTNDVPLRLMNYIMASPYTVWMTNCGTKVEKDLLLNAMLKAAGVYCVFGLLYNHLTTDPESVVIFYLPDNTKYYVSTADLQDVSLDGLKAPDYYISILSDFTPLEVKPMHIQMQADVVVRKEGNTVQADVWTKNYEMENVPKANTLRPLQTKARADVRKLSDGYQTLALSSGSYGCDIRASLLSRHRNTPVEVHLTEECYTYRISLPERTRLITKPYKVEKKYDFGSMTISLSWENDVLVFVRELKLTTNKITSEQYRDFRGMMSEWDVARNIVFKCE